jgi:hypothetical protein
MNQKKAGGRPAKGGIRRKNMLHKDITSSLSVCQAKIIKKLNIFILFGVEKNQS